MAIGLVMTWIVVGLLSGALAKFAVSEHGHGLRWDLLLGVGGSGVACVGAWSFAAAGDMGAFAIAAVGLSGAIVVIVAQRSVWPGPDGIVRRVRVVAKSRVAAKSRR